MSTAQRPFDPSAENSVVELKRLSSALSCEPADRHCGSA